MELFIFYSLTDRCLDNLACIYNLYPLFYYLITYAYEHLQFTLCRFQKVS